MNPPRAGGNPGLAHQDYRVDPTREDLIKRLVELRASVRARKRDAQDAGDEAEAARLHGVQQSFKVEANAIAYGIPIEFNVSEHRRAVTVTSTSLTEAATGPAHAEASTPAAGSTH